MVESRLNNLPGGTATLSRRFLPKNAGGTLEIVTTECRLPPGAGAGAVDSVAKNSACLGEGPDAPSPLSDNLLT